MNNLFSRKLNTGIFYPIILNYGQVVKLKGGVFLKTYSSTNIKMNHIKKICSELLNCELNFIK